MNTHAENLSLARNMAADSVSEATQRVVSILSHSTKLAIFVKHFCFVVVKHILKHFFSFKNISSTKFNHLFFIDSILVCSTPGKIIVKRTASASGWRPLKT